MQTDSEKPVAGGVGSMELLGWLRDKIVDAEKAVRAREQMESCWRGGTDELWKAVGCKMNKDQRLKESAMHGRIAVKCRREVEMFNAVLAALNPNDELKNAGH